MNLRDLSQALAPLVGSMHPLTETNVEGVSQDGGMVLLDFDTAELEAEIKELKEDVARFTDEIKSLEDESAKTETRADALEALLDEVKDEAEPGLTLREARDKYAEWRHISDIDKRISEEARAELTALRKKKGVTANLFANERVVLLLLSRIAKYPKDAAMHAAEATVLLNKLHVK